MALWSSEAVWSSGIFLGRPHRQLTFENNQRNEPKCIDLDSSAPPAPRSSPPHSARAFEDEFDSKNGRVERKQGVTPSWRQDGCGRQDAVAPWFDGAHVCRRPLAWLFWAGGSEGPRHRSPLSTGASAGAAPSHGSPADTPPGWTPEANREPPSLASASLTAKEARCASSQAQPAASRLKFPRPSHGPRRTVCGRPCSR